MKKARSSQTAHTPFEPILVPLCQELLGSPVAISGRQFLVSLLFSNTIAPVLSMALQQTIAKVCSSTYLQSQWMPPNHAVHPTILFSSIPLCQPQISRNTTWDLPVATRGWNSGNLCFPSYSLLQSLQSPAKTHLLSGVYPPTLLPFLWTPPNLGVGPAFLLPVYPQTIPSSPSLYYVSAPETQNPFLPQIPSGHTCLVLRCVDHTVLPDLHYCPSIITSSLVITCLQIPLFPPQLHSLEISTLCSDPWSHSCQSLFFQIFFFWPTTNYLQDVL